MEDNLVPEVLSLFPTPVYVAKLEREFSELELDLFLTAEMRPNATNKSSQDSRILDREDLSELKKEVEKHLNSFFQHVYSPRDEVTPYVTQSWVNHTAPGESHHLHRHTNSFLSGVIYIQVTEGLDSIYFHQSRNYPWYMLTKEQNKFNAENCMVPVEKGKIIIFPSEVQHYVEPVEGDSLRVSLSFNSFLRGKIGSDSALCSLELK